MVGGNNKGFDRAYDGQKFFLLHVIKVKCEKIAAAMAISQNKGTIGWFVSSS